MSVDAERYQAGLCVRGCSVVMDGMTRFERCGQYPHALGRGYALWVRKELAEILTHLLNTIYAAWIDQTMVIKGIDLI